VKQVASLIALAAVVVIPTALWLGWNKRMSLAVLLLLGYALVLGTTWWKAKRQ